LEKRDCAEGQHGGVHGTRFASCEKALAIAALAIEEQPGPFQAGSDLSDMKALLDELIENDTELAYYARAARIAVRGEPD
jgi:hypothetical protein